MKINEIMDNAQKSFMCLDNIHWEGYWNGKYEIRKFVKGEVYHWYEIGIYNFNAGTFLENFKEITPRTKAEEILNILNISYDKPYIDMYLTGNGRKHYILWTDFEEEKFIKITESQYNDIKKLYEVKNV